MHRFRRGIPWAIAALLGLSVLGQAMPGRAAESVVFRYRLFRRSISVAELSNFAATGALSPDLRAYFNRSGTNPEEVRQVLNRQVEVNALVLDQVLNSPVGNVAIDRVSRAIHTPSRRGDRQAMRSALVLSATDDNRVSLIEVVEKYPTQEVHVDGEHLAQTYQEIVALQQQIQRVGNILERLPRF